MYFDLTGIHCLTQLSILLSALVPDRTNVCLTDLFTVVRLAECIVDYHMHVIL